MKMVLHSKHEPAIVENMLLKGLTGSSDYTIQKRSGGLALIFQTKVRTKITDLEPILITLQQEHGGTRIALQTHTLRQDLIICACVSGISALIVALRPANNAPKHYIITIAATVAASFLSMGLKRLLHLRSYARIISELLSCTEVDSYAKTLKANNYCPACNRLETASDAKTCSVCGNALTSLV